MTAEGASDSSAVRYAPPDPTLPEPWKGLIDGSSGAMYYWNPETNVTQYHKPAAVAPPVPSVPPPVPSATTSVSAPGTMTEQPNGIPAQQMPPLQGNNVPQQYPGAIMEQSQGYSFTHNQPMHYMGYQQRPPNMMQPLQHLQQYPQQQDPVAHNQPSDVNPIQTPPTQFGGSQFNMQQPSPYAQLPQSSVEYQQHGPKFQNQMGQQPNVPPVGVKFEDNPPGRGGNDHYYNNNNGVPAMAPYQPKLAAIPMARNQPEMKAGGHVHHNVPPSFPGGPTSLNVYGQVTGGPPFMNNTMMMGNPAVMAPPDAMSLSSVDVYRQKHDVPSKIWSQVLTAETT
ncbi:uncharacterized protein LOC143568352 [Bidens hawaiensis]|uniref:uncharacterized protein LOC143568352 n=1 Tax=Bidens hawaiensis TaxID=980011 RepID=UPI004049981E